MIREGNMLKYDKYCYRSSQPADEVLSNTEQSIMSTAEKLGVPVEAYRDKVMGMGLLSKQTDECICIAHPKHKNTYLKFCIRISESNGSTFIDTYHYGHSKSAKMDEMMQNSKEKNLKHGIWGVPNALIGMGALKLVKGSNKKQQEEEQWYSSVVAVIEEALS